MHSGSQAPLRSTRLLDQLRERIRYCHYSLRTEQAYVYWVRWFIRFNGLRHPRQMGATEVEAFLSFLANTRRVSPATHRQALCAIVFLYKHVLGVDLPWLQEIGRPQARRRVPVVLSRDEVARVLAQIEGVYGLVARPLYGSGLRLLEGLQLRIKDVDFDRRVIIVRDGKGSRDRVVMLPAALEQALRDQIAVSRARWARDRAERRPGVWLPDAPSLKYPRAGRKLGLALGIPRAQPVRRSALRRTAPPSPVRSDRRSPPRAGRRASADSQARHRSHPAPLVRHPHA